MDCPSVWASLDETSVKDLGEDVTERSAPHIPSCYPHASSRTKLTWSPKSGFYLSSVLKAGAYLGGMLLGGRRVSEWSQTAHS